MLVEKWRPSARSGDVAACLSLLSRELRTAHEIQDTKIRKKNAKKVMDVLTFFLFSERRLLGKRGSEQVPTPNKPSMPLQISTQRHTTRAGFFE